MSVNYAAGLSDYPHKGKCGLPETFDSPEEFETKMADFVKLVRESKHIVFHTGAGVSTSAGIPDFRGPKGVWTLEQKGETPQMNITFDDAKPSLTHMALVKLVEENIVQYIVSQNVDGLHLKSGLPRAKFSELHGNMFIEKCDRCESEYIRKRAITTVGLKRTGRVCEKKGTRGHCRGKLRDTILDWEDALPYKDLVAAEQHSRQADLSVCLGTSLQIQPSGNLPVHTIKNGGKLVVVNLQKTRHDKKATLIIHDYVDKVMKNLMESLGIPIPPFTGKPWWTDEGSEVNKKGGKEDSESRDGCDSPEACSLPKRTKWDKRNSIDTDEKEVLEDGCQRFSDNPSLQLTENGSLRAITTQSLPSSSKATAEVNGMFKREPLDEDTTDTKTKFALDLPVDACNEEHKSYH